MRAHIIRSILVLLVLLCTPRTAHADLMSFWEWLDRMSGPGPWVGVVSEWNAWGYGTKKHDVEIQGGKAVQGKIFDPFGNEFSQRDLHIRFGPQIGYLRALYNDLDYGGDKVPKANAFVYGATVDAGAKGVEAGLAAGWVRFYGDGFGFTKTTIQPRVTAYPLVWFYKAKEGVSVEEAEREKWTNRWADAFYVRVGANRIIGSISAADFGAFESGSPEKMGDEWLWSIVISVNPLASKKKVQKP